MEAAVPPPPAAEGALAAPWRKAGRWLGLVLLGLVILAGLVVAVLDTGAGRGLVARQLSGTTFANGLRIEIGRIDGSLYGKARLVDLVAYDAKGPFLRAPRVDLDWRPFAYLAGHVDIRSAVAPSAVLQRAPALKVTNPHAPLLPDLDIVSGQLRIDRMVS